MQYRLANVAVHQTRPLRLRQQQRSHQHDVVEREAPLGGAGAVVEDRVDVDVVGDFTLHNGKYKQFYEREKSTL